MNIVSNVKDYSAIQVFILPSNHSDKKTDDVRDDILNRYARAGDTVLHEYKEQLPTLPGVIKKSWYDPAVTKRTSDVVDFIATVEATSDEKLKSLFKEKLPPNYAGDIRNLARRVLQIMICNTCDETFDTNQKHLLSEIEQHLSTDGHRLFASMGKYHLDQALRALLERSNVNYAIVAP